MHGPQQIVPPATGRRGQASARLTRARRALGVAVGPVMVAVTPPAPEARRLAGAPADVSAHSARPIAEPGARSITNGSTIVRDLLPFLADLGSCWIKLSGPYRIAKSRPLSYVGPVGRALVSTRPDRLIWGSDWPHLPDGQRDTGELLNVLGDWAPDEADRQRILVEAPDRLFFSG